MRMKGWGWSMDADKNGAGVLAWLLAPKPLVTGGRFNFYIKELPSLSLSCKCGTRRTLPTSLQTT